MSFLIPPIAWFVACFVPGTFDDEPGPVETGESRRSLRSRGPRPWRSLRGVYGYPEIGYFLAEQRSKSRFLLSALSVCVFWILSGTLTTWALSLYLGYSREAIGDLYPFGLKMFLKNLLIYGSNKVDYFIIAKRMPRP